MDNTSNPLFIDQEDGSALPSPELLDRIRANPEQYPTAAQDLADVSGKTVEEVEAILANGTPQTAWEREGLWGVAKQVVRNDPVTGGIIDIYQGEADAVSTFAKKLGYDDAAETISNVGDSLDPKFTSEQGTVETITEDVGQSVPAIGAGAAITAATGGTGAIPYAAGVLAAGVVDTATRENDDNAFNALNEIAPGITPDALVVTDDDDNTTATAKHFIGNLVADGAIGVVTGAASALVRAVATKAPPSVVKPLLVQAQAQVTPPVIPTVVAEDITKKASQRRLAQKLELEAQPNPKLAPDPLLDQERQVFHQKTLAPVNRLETRNAETNSAYTRFVEKNKPELLVYADKVLETVRSGDRVALRDALMKPPMGTDAAERNYFTTYHQAVLREVMAKLHTDLDSYIQLVRDAPDIKTKAALKTTLGNYFDTVGDVFEIDRHLGSAASYQFHIRQGNDFGVGGDLYTEAMDELKKQFPTKDLERFNLFSDKTDFLAAEMLSVERMGLDSTLVLTHLDDTFKEFDAMRRGVIETAKNRGRVTLTPYEKLSWVGKTVRLIKEVQTKSLLGQLSTTGMEAASNTFNAMVLPVLEHGMRGDFRLAAREYVGYLHAMKQARTVLKTSWKTGKAVVNGEDMLEGAHGVLDVGNFKNPVARLLVRTYTFAVDVALASREFTKAMRAGGLAYADGIEMAFKAGMGRKDARLFAKTYMTKQFDAEGHLLNPKIQLDLTRSMWESSIDTRYQLGKLAALGDSLRNSDNAASLIARFIVPFYRTLINIGSDAAQYIVPPGLPLALRKIPAAKNMPKLMRALDDFTGNNGQVAMNRANGRHRLGMLFMGSAYALAETGQIEITGPSVGQRWDAKKRSFEVLPANSIFIDGKAYDLTRGLPFTAPLMLVGMMRDMKREDENRLTDGGYHDAGFYDYFANYFPALGLTSMTLFQDSAALQGVFGLSDALSAAKDGNTDEFVKYLQKIPAQFTPGAVKMVGKNLHPETYEGYDFYSRFLQASGLPTEFKRLDFIGKEIKEGWRGIDAFNSRTTKLDDPLYAKFAELNRYEDLAMALPRPDAVFTKASWKALGIDEGGIFAPTKVPDLSKMTLPNGKNAWDAYRDWVYKGELTEGTIKKSTAAAGDRIYVGDVQIKVGENLEQALRRHMELEDFKAMTSGAQAKVFDTLLNIYQDNAKEFLEENLKVKPDVFTGGRYGVPIKEPTSVKDTIKQGKDLATSVQTTQGSRIEDAFAIKE